MAFERNATNGDLVVNSFWTSRRAAMHLRIYSAKRNGYWRYDLPTAHSVSIPSKMKTSNAADLKAFKFIISSLWPLQITVGSNGNALHRDGETVSSRPTDFMHLLHTLKNSA